jgi:hypothetical protein
VNDDEKQSDRVVQKHRAMAFIVETRHLPAQYPVHEASETLKK